MSFQTIKYSEDMKTNEKGIRCNTTTLTYIYYFFLFPCGAISWVFHGQVCTCVLPSALWSVSYTFSSCFGNSVTTHYAGVHSVFHHALFLNVFLLMNTEIAPANVIFKMKKVLSFCFFFFVYDFYSTQHFSHSFKITIHSILTIVTF